MVRKEVMVFIKDQQTKHSEQFTCETVLTVEEIIKAIEDANYIKWSGAPLKDQYNEYKKGMIQ